jgi:hypothetical protein
MGLIAIGFQIPLLWGITTAKIRALLPRPVGHAQMFQDPQPLAEIGWFKALGGLIASAVVIAAFAFYENGIAV